MTSQHRSRFGLADSTCVYRFRVEKLELAGTDSQFYGFVRVMALSDWLESAVLTHFFSKNELLLYFRHMEVA